MDSSPGFLDPWPLPHEAFDKITTNCPPPGCRLPDAGFPGAALPVSQPAFGSGCAGLREVTSTLPKSRPPPVSTGTGSAGLPVPDGRVGSLKLYRFPRRYSADRAGWRPFIDRIEGQGWRLSAKAAGLRRWPGTERLPGNGESHLVRQGIPRPDRRRRRRPDTGEGIRRHGRPSGSKLRRRRPRGRCLAPPREARGERPNSGVSPLAVP